MTFRLELCLRQDCTLMQVLEPLQDQQGAVLGFDTNLETPTVLLGFSDRQHANKFVAELTCYVLAYGFGV